MIVVDASALLEGASSAQPAGTWRWKEPAIRPQQTLAVRLICSTSKLRRLIRRYAAKGEIDSERGRAALADLGTGDFPLRRYPA